MPRLAIVRGLYTFYFRHVLPLIGRWLSRHDSAYSYLPSSVVEFPQRDEFLAAMHRSGFEAARWQDLSGGTVCLSLGEESMTRILDGKALAAQLRTEVAAAVQELLGRGGQQPGLAAILVGEDPATTI